MNRGEPSISRRKTDHIALALSGDAELRDVSTLLEDVHLIHQALPELALDEIDLGTELVGRTLAAPLVVAGMTGGTAEAGVINRDLARAAEALGIGFGLGSQRAMLLHPELATTYQVRDVAPNVFLLGNIGVVQARDIGVAKLRDLVAAVAADALCVHLNPAMELIQEDGDRDFRGALDTLRRLVSGLGIPVIAKETGCGLSRQAAAALRRAGIAAVDVGGAGGTSWVAVETQRSRPESPSRALGEALWDWGIPTAVSVTLCRREGLQVIATGGLRNGRDVAAALALGAVAGGFAAPVLRAHRAAGYEGVVRFLSEAIALVRAVSLLSGCRRAQDLATAPRYLGERLHRWLEAA